MWMLRGLLSSHALRKTTAFTRNLMMLSFAKRACCTMATIGTCTCDIAQDSGVNFEVAKGELYLPWNIWDYRVLNMLTESSTHYELVVKTSWSWRALPEYRDLFNPSYVLLNESGANASQLNSTSQTCGRLGNGLWIHGLGLCTVSKGRYRSHLVQYS